MSALSACGSLRTRTAPLDAFPAAATCFEEGFKAQPASAIDPNKQGKACFLFPLPTAVVKNLP